MGASPSKDEETRLGGNGGVADNVSSSMPSLPMSSLLAMSLLGKRLPPCRCDASAAPPPPPPLLAPPGASASASASATTTTTSKAPPPPASESEAQIAEAAASATRASVPNPGPYEHASMDAKRLVSLDTHDGVRVDINKQLSPYMPVVHSFWLGTDSLPDGRHKTYTFLAQVADERGLLMARVDPERGSVDGRVHRAVLGGLANLKVQAGVSVEGQSDQLLAEADFDGLTWTANLKYGSMGGGIVYGCNYYQSITDRWAAGGEGMYVASNHNWLTNYTLKYKMPAKGGPSDDDDDDDNGRERVLKAAEEHIGSIPKPKPLNSSATLNYNTAQSLLSLHYQRTVTPNRVSLGAELQCSPSTLESQVTLGAEFNLTRSKVNLCVDGSGRLQSTLETKLGMGHGSPTLSFSAEVDHVREVLKFGYGMNIGG